MLFKHIEKDGDDLKLLNDSIYSGKNAFILVYMDGCGPCGETLPKWKNIETVLNSRYKNNDSILVASVNKDLLSSIPYIGSIEGFPTMKFVSDKGTTLEVYENTPYGKGERSTSSFVNWIESKMDNYYSELPKQTKPSKKRKQGKTNKKSNARTNKKTNKQTNKRRKSKSNTRK